MDCFRLRSSSYGGHVAALAMTENRDTVSFSVNPLILFHNATHMRSRFKLWNESGTKHARIADSAHSCSVHRNISRWVRWTRTRSSLTGLHKRRFLGGIVKVEGSEESNQKRGRVKQSHRALSFTSPRRGEVGEARSDEPGEGSRRK